ncbi:hypothetical protein Leryth_009723 [Lithospermum erythrorhizon]|nr:hypothetical protein Leryth_009723 [Lithospermum erythrorhizon]
MRLKTSATNTSTPLTTGLFMEWKRKKTEERDAKLASQRADRAKNDRMSLFVDDAEAYDKYQREDEADVSQNKVNNDSPVDGPSSSMAGHQDNGNNDADEDIDVDDDDDLDMDELNELEASLAKTSLRINEPGA